MCEIAWLMLLWPLEVEQTVCFVTDRPTVCEALLCLECIVTPLICGICPVLVYGGWSSKAALMQRLPFQKSVSAT